MMARRRIWALVVAALFAPAGLGAQNTGRFPIAPDQPGRQVREKQQMQALDVEEGDVAFSLSVGIAGYPWVTADRFIDNHARDLTGQDGPVEDKSRYRGSRVHCSGLITVDADFQIYDWLMLTLQLGFDRLWAQRYNAGSTIFGNAFHVMPTAKFTYFRAPYVVLYSGFGVGAGIYQNFHENTSAYSGFGDNNFAPEVQAVPIAARFHVGPVFGFAELGVGTLYMGGRIGFGYTF